MGVPYESLYLRRFHAVCDDRSAGKRRLSGCYGAHDADGKYPSCIYGITMLTKYQKAGRKKPYLIFALTDETFSVVCDVDLPEGVEENAYYFWISLLDQIYWVLGSLLGSIIGNTLPFNSAGVEFSMTALFVVIFVEQWEKTKQHFPALCGVLLSLLSLFIFGADDFLIPAMIGITIALLIGKKWVEKG